MSESGADSCSTISICSNEDCDEIFLMNFHNFQLMVGEIIRKLQVRSCDGFIKRKAVVKYIQRKFPHASCDIKSRVQSALIGGVKSGFIRRGVYNKYQFVVPIASTNASIGQCRTRALQRAERIFGSNNNRIGGTKQCCCKRNKTTVKRHIYKSKKTCENSNIILKCPVEEKYSKVQIRKNLESDCNNLKKEAKN